MLTGWQANTSFVDRSVNANAAYYYWIKAAASSTGDRASDYSFFAIGSSVEVPRPQLTAFYQTGRFILSWSTNWVAFPSNTRLIFLYRNRVGIGFVPSVIDGHFIVTNNFSDPQRFFRLRQ